MAFCSKCGSEIKEGNAFCPNCGNAVSGINNISYNQANKKKPSKKTISLVACITGLLIVIITVISITNNTGKDNYEEVASEYCVALFSGDWAELDNYLPYDPEDIYYDLYEYPDTDYDEMEPYYDVTADVIRSTKISSARMEDLIDNIKDEWDYYDIKFDDYINESKISEGYYVDMDVSVYEPADDEYWGSETFRFAVVKYKGKWKVLTDFAGELEEFYEVWD